MWRRLNGALKKTIIELREKGLSLSQIAERVGVSRNTLSKWINSDPAFKEAITRAEEQRWQDIAELAIDVLKQSLQSQKIVDYEIHKTADGNIKRVVEYIKTIPPDADLAFKILEKLEKRLEQRPQIINVTITDAEDDANVTDT